MHRVDRSVDRIVFFKKSRVVVHQRLEVHTRKLLDSKLKQLYSQKKKVIVWWPFACLFLTPIVASEAAGSREPSRPPPMSVYSTTDAAQVRLADYTTYY